MKWIKGLLGLKSSISDLVKRNVLLILLQQNNYLELSKIEKIIPDWKNHVQFLQNLNLDINEDKGQIVLKSEICFDLYQSIPPEILKDVQELLYKILERPKIIDPQSIMHKILVPNNIDDDKQEYPCINCANPPCMMYDTVSFGSVDKFPSRVCPDDLIKPNDEALIQINEVPCTGCTLCMIRCPFNSISLDTGKPVKQSFTDTDIGKSVTIKDVNIDEKIKITSEIKSKISKKPKQIVFKNNLKDVLDNFDDKVSNSNQNWDRDKYYVFIRNIFRELGINANYTGSGGQLRRADVTIEDPFLVGIEIKSPAESDASVGAIRQAIDARTEVVTTYKSNVDETYCAVIAQGISRGAHKKAVENHATLKVIIPIIRGRILLYILLKHVTNLPQDPSDLKKLFTDYIGEVGNNELKNYFEKYFQARIDEINIDTLSLPLPTGIDITNKNEAIVQIEILKKEINAEIDICFSISTRAQRGSYSK